jgi:hypothetical protein
MYLYVEDGRSRYFEDGRVMCADEHLSCYWERLFPFLNISLIVQIVHEGPCWKRVSYEGCVRRLIDRAESVGGGWRGW